MSQFEIQNAISILSTYVHEKIGLSMEDTYQCVWTVIYHGREEGGSGILQDGYLAIHFGMLYQEKRNDFLKVLYDLDFHAVIVDPRTPWSLSNYVITREKLLELSNTIEAQRSSVVAAIS